MLNVRTRESCKGIASGMGGDGRAIPSNHASSSKITDRKRSAGWMSNLNLKD